MAAAVYTLNIRDEPGDDSHWQQVRVVAASLADALAQAQRRFGDERVMAIAQVEGVAGDDVVAGSLAGAQVAATAGTTPFDVAVPEPRTVHIAALADALADSDTFADADAFAAAATDGIAAPPREPMPWEGRWRPSVLLRIGAAAGVLLFVAWYQFGAPAREQFVTAAPVATGANQGLALEGEAPRGGVLAATGVPLRRGDATPDIGKIVGETVANWPQDEAERDGQGGDIDDSTVRTIGTLVGDLFAHEADETDEADPPPYRTAQPREPVGEPRSALPWGAPPATINAREPSVMHPFYVGVDRGGGIIETLRVTAYDADHARQIISDLPERPIIVRGPTTRLDW